MRLELLFTEKQIYRNPDLTIWNVSDEMNSNRTYVSNFINRCYGINFSRFVNQYRINEAKSILKETKSIKFSLETIGEKCGFGSLNNFIRVFHSFEGITPGIYRKRFTGNGYDMKSPHAADIPGEE
jgi:AraC-like DNA-binding protein